VSENPYESPKTESRPASELDPTKPQSFRLSRPPYIDGMRVKPRLARIANTCTWVGAAAWVLGLVLTLALTSALDLPPAARIFGSIFFSFVALYGAIRGSLMYYQSRGMLTAEEARNYPFNGYDESWIEPIDSDRSDDGTFPDSPSDSPE